MLPTSDFQVKYLQKRAPFKGWLEPLLYEIKKDRTNVICPIIDVISDDTFEFLTGSDLTYGGFNWKLNFRQVMKSGVTWVKANEFRAAI